MTCRIAALAAAALTAFMASLSPLAGAGSARAQTGPSTPTAMTPELARLAEERPVIELVTMGVGSLIWERHGHIALCVRGDGVRADRCYNYGIGDFRHPLAMTWGFFRGTGSFWVGKAGVEDMLSIYEYADRTIWVQPLPLTRAQKKLVIEKLEFDILEPNRYYAYDHFWDNCTTRVRDVIDVASGGQLSSMREPTDDRTFRDLAREGFYGMRIPLLITDIAMGRVTDRQPTYQERMFLPQYLREAVTKLWGVEPRVIYQRQGPPQDTDSSSGRVWFAIAIIAMTSPSWIARLIGRWQRAGLALSVAPYVLLGTVLTFLAIISPLPYVRWNEICLVVLPLDVLVLVLPPDRRRWYARGRLVMLGAVLVLWLVGILCQPLLAPLLWPAIPLAVVGLWPDKPVRIGEAGAPEAAGRPAPRKPRPKPGKRR
jgi:hypothetical protein